MSINYAAKQAIWTRGILGELGHDQKTPTYFNEYSYGICSCIRSISFIITCDLAYISNFEEALNITFHSEVHIGKQQPNPSTFFCDF